MIFRRALAATLSLTSVVAVLAVLPATPAAAAPGIPTQVNERTFSGVVKESSPTVANINGQQSIVFGSHNGNVYAINASTFADVPGWPRQTGNAINSSPAVADIDGNGSNEVFIGSGTAAARAGDAWGFNSDGSTRWRFSPADPVDPNNSVHSSPAIGDVNSDGIADVSAFTLGLNAWSFNASDGKINGGWPIFQDDSVFSSPALADVDGDGQTDYVVGGDSTEGAVVDKRGGVLRALRGDGSVIWQFFADDIFRSSPVIGDVTGDGVPEIVIGTGDYWDKNGSPNADSRKVWVLNMRGQLLWSRDLGGYAMAAPSLADVNGDGRLDIIEPTWNGVNAGAIYVFDGSGNALPNWNGKPTRSNSTRDPILGQIATADLDNDGGQDLLVAHGAGLYAYSGKTGAEFFHVNQGPNDQSGTIGAGYENTPWVGDIDGNGRLDIVLAGNRFGSSTDGIVTRFEMNDTVARLGARGWHQFGKDNRHTSNAAVNVPLTQNRCDDVPNQGYLLHAADGGVFSYCRNFYGSMGGKPLNQPIVGAASTPDRGGYWQVARDGGIFSFGNAQFYGSTGNITLNQPIVGMAALPNGRGYWLVAADGGVFSYGDAGFKGSTGNLRLNQPIVGMAAAPDGNGYWLVARDGGIFAFGSAKFMGSTGSIRLNQPIVGMAATTTGDGYWLVAADGGIFTFGYAPFFGSTGGTKLNAPIVGMQTNGRTYRLVASDGGVFAFGGAPFLGSAGNIRLNRPIIGVN